MGNVFGLFAEGQRAPCSNEGEPVRLQDARLEQNFSSCFRCICKVFMYNSHLYTIVKSNLLSKTHVLFHTLIYFFHIYVNKGSVGQISAFILLSNIIRFAVYILKTCLVYKSFTYSPLIFYDYFAKQQRSFRN